MSHTASALITEAWYTSEIVARGFETVSGEQMTDGLFLLNALLATKTLKSRQIPYFAEYELETEAGTASYYIPGLVTAETLVFFIGDVRYQIDVQGRKEFFGSDCVDGIQGPPWSGRLERVLGGTRLYLYLVPDQAYTVIARGKFSPGAVTIDQDLSLTMDDFYQEYLRYALAKKMCQYYGLIFPHEDELLNLEQAITDVSPLDLTIKTISTLSRGGSLNWGQINLGKGWTTP